MTTSGVIELSDSFRDLLVELYDAEADFVVVGAHAVAFHGQPRATEHLDVLVRADPANSRRVYKAIAALGDVSQGLDVAEQDFATYEGTLQIGPPLARIGVLNHAEGISFDEAIAEEASFELVGRRIPVIGLDALRKHKRAAGDAQDLADLEALSGA